MTLQCCSAIYFINLRGDILLERKYRDDVDRSIAENFRTKILNEHDRDSGSVQTPVRTLGSVSFLYLRHSDLYILSLVKSNVNVMLAFKFMTSIVNLFKSYMGELTETTLKNNFVLIYELLDEVCDFGFPQVTEPSILKEFIFQKGYKSEFFGDSLEKKKEMAQNATLAVTGAVGWRREGIRYKKNEVYLDIIETVNLLMSSNGNILRNDVVGMLKMKCFLSDMPELRLGLNDQMQDATFHPCVNLANYEAQKVVTFVPPDGEFELMRYRCQEGISLPFKILPVVNEVGRTKLECNINIKSGFSNKLMATNMVVLIPVPEHTATAKILVTAGKAKYDATKKALVWKIAKFVGSSEHTLRAEVNLVSTTKEKKVWSRPPIQLHFQVPMASSSGLRVSYLKVLERKQGAAYKVDKWVRKMTKSGDYLIRT